MKAIVIKEGLSFYNRELKIGDTFELTSHGSFSRTEGYKDLTIEEPTISFSDDEKVLLDNKDGTGLVIPETYYLRINMEFFELIA